jgi:hypothetical protein
MVADEPEEEANRVEVDSTTRETIVDAADDGVAIRPLIISTAIATAFALGGHLLLGISYALE